MRQRRGGFTLVEVLAAFVLLAVVLPVAMRAISLATAAAENAKRTAEAMALADAKLAEMQSLGEAQAGAVSGDFGAEHPEYRWVMETQQWNESTSDLLQTTVSVLWNSRNQDRAVSVSTLVYAREQ